jgi:diamine N-acetyltransferase
MAEDQPVHLEPIDEHNLKAVYELTVRPGQERFVAPNPWSLAQALVHHSTAWPRAIMAGDEVVGFLMLEIDLNDPDGRNYGLWRLMIAGDRQRRGFGRSALRLACDEVRSRGGTELWTSWVADAEGPGPFYERFGFVRTGEVEDGEVVARLTL